MRSVSLGLGLVVLAGAATGACGPTEGTEASRLAPPPRVSTSESPWLSQLRDRFQQAETGRHSSDSSDSVERVSLLPRSAAALTLREGGFVAAFDSPRRGSLVRAARVEIPVRADGELRVSDPASHVGVRVRLEGARARSGEVDGGFVVHRGGHESGADVLFRPLVEGAEDYLHFAQKPVREAVRYRLSLEGAAGLRLVANTLEVLDAEGAPRLRMAPPRGVDAAGQAIAARVEVEGCAVDTSPAAPWGRPVTAPGAGWCAVEVSWSDAAYPMLLDPLWSTTGSMAKARSAHTASVLTSGKVLVVGGGDSSYPEQSALSSAEVYDPATGTWASTGPMTISRYEHTASVLSDGRVLVVGNDNPAEVYSPATGTWASAGSPGTKRRHHTASVLSDGRVLVAGGYSYGVGTLGSAEVYSPATNTWSGAGSFSTAREGHTASVLQDGKVLVAAGYSGTSYFSSARLYNLATNGWSNTGSMTSAREGHTASVLLDGKVLVAGGKTSNTSFTSVEVYNPAAGTWATTGALAASRAYHTASVLPDGRVLVVGGATISPGFTYLSSATAYDSTTGTWSSAGSSSTARAYHTASVLLDGRTLIVGGRNPTPLSSAEIFGGVRGGACVVGADCLAPLTCVDGFCCNTPCSAANDACSQAKTGQPNGTCAPVANGQPCNGGSECGSGFCSDNFCCDKACDLVSDACAFAQTGLPDGACGPRKNGFSCNGGGECGSGFCSDGVCCDSACAGSCLSCKSADTGALEGVCAPIKVGLDPANECEQIGSGVCAVAGACNGAGACQNKQGTSCGVASCVGNTLTPAPACDAVGGCQSLTGGPCPGNYTCADASSCRTTCDSNDHCANGKTCLSDKTCGSGKGNGASCTNNLECGSGYCVDGTCCSSACDTGCVSCKISETGKTNGECNPVKDGTDPGNDCNASGDPDCGPDGVCDGQGACRGNKNQGVSCGAPPACSGLGVLSNVCDGNGQCAPFQSLPCAGGYACIAGVCLSSCSGDGDCAPSSYCSNGACVAKAKQGEKCSNADHCDTGHCVDGVCCESACEGACVSCLGKNTVGGIDGKCGSAPGGTDPRNLCDPDGSNPCGADGQCDGQGSCRQVAPKGSDCGGSTVCVGTASVSGQLCDGGGTCAPVDSTPCSDGFICSNNKCLTLCGNDSDCTVGHFCNVGACADLLPNGAGCTKAGQCASAFCVDGVCCDTACEGKCMTCLAKASNGADGQCAPVVDGQDPRGSCDPTPGSACLMDGQCDGKGACRSYAPKGTVCGGFACLGADQIAQQECDGVGSCAKVNVSPCGGYACKNDICISSCTSDTDCTQGLVCKNGECVGKLNNGEACKGENQCDSGFCADGVCCDTACLGDCQSCKAASNVAKKDGTCSEVQPGLDPRQKCASDPVNLCGAPGLCGVGGECAKFAPTGTQCGADGCTAESVVSNQCDGFGMCKSKTKQACSPYACDDLAGSCKAKCLSNADCAAGAECNPAKQECGVSGATCVDMFTVQSATGQKTPCAPYSCLNGACKTSCASSAECSSGHACSSGKCIVQMGAGGSAGSAGSSAGGSSPGGGGQAAGGAKGGSAGQASTGAGGTGAQGGSSSGGQAAPAVTDESGDSGGCSVSPGGSPSRSPATLSLWALAALAVASRRKHR